MANCSRRFEPSHDRNDAIRRAGAENRIDREYWDIFHKLRQAPIETEERILNALGWDTSSRESVDARREQTFRAEWTTVLPGVSVLGEDDRSVTVTFPAGTEGEICFDCRLEGGEQVTGTLNLAQLKGCGQIEIGTDRWTVRQLLLPAELPLGYHRMRITKDGTAVGEGAVILCPEQSYLPERLLEGGKLAGFNITLYGLRSERNWGCGDFTDLRKLIEWVRSIGFAFIGLNPLHALHNRVPFNTSPYLPLSIFYKNLIYIDVEQVDEFQRSESAQSFVRSQAVQDKIRQLREAETVQYSDVDRLKKRFLKLLYRQFRRERQAGHGERAREFQAFCDREGELLHNFALYCSLDEVLHKQDRNRWTWPQWPSEYYDPHSDACNAFAQAHARTVEFYKYVQFVLEQQLAAAQQHALDAGLPIGLYHDLALATDSFGADLWAYPTFFVKGCRVGAPPDDLSPNGQDWAFPPPNSETHRKDGYRLYRESIRKIVSHGGALRIDHVMRLFRLFWVPDGASPADGTYVRDFAVELMRILALESLRSRNVIIGEDLGTVTDEIRDLLGRFRILSYRLFPFERNPDGTYKPSSSYPRQALVASSTHDLATLSGFWIARDIDARRAAGLLDEGGYQGQIETRKREKQNMLNTLHEEQLLPHWYERDAEHVPQVDGPLHNAVVGFLARVPSMLLLLNQEDLTQETDQQNLPGSTSEYPNWQRKMRATVDDLQSPAWEPFNEMFRAQLKNSERAI